MAANGEGAGSPSDSGELVVYGAKECCLCDRALEVLRSLAPELGLKVRYVSIDGDPELEGAYRQQIPVGFLDGRKIFKFTVDPARLRRAALGPRGAGGARARESAQGSPGQAPGRHSSK